MEMLQFIKSIASQLQSVQGGVGYADIVLSVDGGERVVFPIVPAELPEIETPQNNDNFEGVLINLSVVGNLACRKISWSSLLPSSVAKYPFCRPNGNNATEVINFVKRYQANFKPMRLAITHTNGAVYVNMLVLCNNFRYYRDNVGDYHYTIDLVEYRDVSTNGVVF